MDKQSFSGDVRRLQRTGHSTHIVSLPKNWVDEMKLRKGDLITILRHGDQSLLLSPRDARKSTENLEATLQISSSENSNSIIRKLVALYFGGFRIIKITDNHPGKNLIEHTNNNLSQLVTEVNSSAYRGT